jgi:hypothetical protein
VSEGEKGRQGDKEIKGIGEIKKAVNLNDLRLFDLCTYHYSFGAGFPIFIPIPIFKSTV